MTWTLGPCRRRAAVAPHIDLPDIEDDALFKAYEFMDFVHKRIGVARTITAFLQRNSHLWNTSRPIAILEVRCGRGDLSAAISKWAKSRGHEVRILAIDPNPQLIHVARRIHSGIKDVVFETRDYTDPIFLKAQKFDYVVSSMTLYRLSWDQISSFLKTCNLLARRGIMLSDWLRDIRAYAWMSALAKLWGDEVIRNDGPLTIRKGLTVPEIEAVASASGLDYVTVARHFGYRFSISGERGLNLSPQLGRVVGLAGA